MATIPIPVFCACLIAVFIPRSAATKPIESLASKFNINSNIELIEVYDNSHIQGSDSVGSLICFSNEGFVKKRYRKFNIKDEKVKNDDLPKLIFKKKY